ncbi:MAG: response regulator [Acidobacteriota bacterium]|nr:response regulator [Acidobacteriota bacterium]
MHQIKILYAEDYDLVLSTVKQLLELEGWAVDVCRDGATALKQIESNKEYDLLLLDDEMPVVRGIELVRRARSLPHRRETPIIIFTAGDCGEEVLASGAGACLKKPSGLRDLIRTIEDLIDRQSPPLRISNHGT